MRIQWLKSSVVDCFLYCGQDINVLVCLPSDMVGKVFIDAWDIHEAIRTFSGLIVLLPVFTHHAKGNKIEKKSENKEQQSQSKGCQCFRAVKFLVTHK